MSVDETQRRLIETAERLFAQNGLDGVTVKQITNEAGQRNASALQYHFGARPDLVSAIVGHRMPAINQRRHAMLDELETHGRDGDLRAVVEAMVLPLAEQLKAEAANQYYVKFLSQAWAHPASDLPRAVNNRHTTSVVRAGLMAGGIMRALPAEVIKYRLSILSGIIVHSLADFARGLFSDTDPNEADTEIFVENLIDSVAGMLSAPASPSTMGRLGK